MTKKDTIAALSRLPTRQLYLLQYLKRLWDDKPELGADWAQMILAVVKDVEAASEALGLAQEQDS